MKQIRAYMDEAARAGIVKNDAEIAKRLNVASATVSRWRSGERAPDDEQAIALAQMIGKPEGELLAECAAARSKSATARAAWERIAKMASMTTATITLAVVTTIVTAPTATASNGAGFQPKGLYYVNLHTS